MISTKNITFSYNKDQTFIMPDLFCQAGNTILVTGNSGKGKTTYLHILAGLLQPNSGEIVIDNKEITHLKGSKADKFRGKNIGVVFQKSHFIASLSVLENLEMASWLATGKKHKARAQELLQKLDISEQAHKLPSQLSVGQQQRVSIARVLAKKPKIIFADEPTGNLDDKTAQEVMNVLFEYIEKENAALLLVTHNHQLAKQCTYVRHLHVDGLKEEA